MDADREPGPRRTRVLKVARGRLGEDDRDAIDQAARAIRQGGLVAFPTETVYGLGADGLDAAAVARVFEAKGRPWDNPLILHVADPGAARDLMAEVPEGAADLMARFWPGPLTLVVPRSEAVPDAVTGGLDTVAVRCPDHPVAQALLQATDRPIAAPSANRSGRPSPTRAEHVLEDLKGRIDLVLDGGPTGLGVESTVLDLTGPRPRILRPGGLAAEDLAELLPSLALAGDETTGPGEEGGLARSPGTKYRHYAPGVPLILVLPPGGPTSRGPGWGPDELAWVADRVGEARAEGQQVGLLVSEETAGHLSTGISEQAVEVEVLAPWGDPGLAAERLFAKLRSLGACVDLIVAEPVQPTGLGRAVMNRLAKAATEVVYVVDQGPGP